MTNSLYMLVLSIIIYVIITFLLTLTGIEKQHQGMRIFFISLLLTPLAGLIYLISEKRKATRIKFYSCSECDYIFPEKIKHCPICEEKGMKVKLTKYVSPYAFTKNIKPIRLA